MLYEVIFYQYDMICFVILDNTSCQIFSENIEYKHEFIRQSYSIHTQIVVIIENKSFHISLLKLILIFHIDQRKFFMLQVSGYNKPLASFVYDSYETTKPVAKQAKCVVKHFFRNSYVTF